MDNGEQNMTPMQAATKFKAMLVEKYGESETTELVLWNKKKSAAMFEDETDDGIALCWEGGPDNWAVNESLTDFAISFPGILVEPYNYFILCFYTY